MPFDFIIGNKSFELDDTYDGGGYWTVSKVRVKDAPDFPNDHYESTCQNFRSTSCSFWKDLAWDTRLTNLFDELMAGEDYTPVPLTTTHLKSVEDAVARWKQQYPQNRPGFTGKLDPILACLLWLEWWMGWALKTCETPAFEWR